MKNIFSIYCCLFSLFECSCNPKESTTLPIITCQYTGDTSQYTPFSKPNIIFILADDIGYEIPHYTGGQSYLTPNIDNLAANGTQFTQCFSTPNCSPSRVELMSGLYNFRNYSKWGIYNTGYKTIANLLKDGGYKTCVSGKWQLDGGDASIKKMGFDDYLVFDPFQDAFASDEGDKENDFRYKNPSLYINGNFLPSAETDGKYSEDLFTQHICKFINDNRTAAPLFVYYPMSLCHMPFFPTPNNTEFAAFNPATETGKPRYFFSMVAYMDKMVGTIQKTVKDLKMDKDTYIIFAGDNGSPTEISSQFNGQTINGGKGSTNEYGTHVPLTVYCIQKVAVGAVKNNLIDFTDFLPTLANMADVPVPVDFGAIDGHSFFNQLNGNSALVRDWIFCYWNPSSFNDTRYKRYAQNDSYKLYDSSYNNNFFKISTDKAETFPLASSSLSAAEINIKTNLQQVLDSLKN